MTASILTIGDELLIGQVVDTNAAWLGRKLSELGLRLTMSLTVGDSLSQIRRALRQALEASDAVICTGGLGATSDDLTREAVAAELGLDLEIDQQFLDRIAEYHRRRERPMSPAARRIAEVPAGFALIDNPVGLAPGLWFHGAMEDGGEHAIALLPGIPREMEAMMMQTVFPRLAELRGTTTVQQKTILTVGAPESAVEERIGDLSQSTSPDVQLAFLPDYGVVRLRITAEGPSAPETSQRLARFETQLRERLGDLVFGEGDQSLPEVVGEMLRSRGASLAVAESCTGGRLGDAITNVPGSSDYFVGGGVVYSNESKARLLEVDPEVLRRHGAVSEAVAAQMAEGARRIFGADIAIATTGVAGPGGGTPATPVGTVWLGYHSDAGTRTVRLQLGGDRDTIKLLTVTAALNLIRRQLLREGGASSETSGS